MYHALKIYTKNQKAKKALLQRLTLSVLWKTAEGVPIDSNDSDSKAGQTSNAVEPRLTKTPFNETFKL